MLSTDGDPANSALVAFRGGVANPAPTLEVAVLVGVGVGAGGRGSLLFTHDSLTFLDGVFGR